MGKHEKPIPVHVHEWKMHGYDRGMGKVLWKCACGEQEWREPQ